MASALEARRGEIACGLGLAAAAADEALTAEDEPSFDPASRPTLDGHFNQENEDAEPVAKKSKSGDME